MGTVAPPQPPILSQREELMMRLFNEMQVARYNVIYYQTRGAQVRRLSTGSNVLAAITSSAAFFGLLSSVGTPQLAIALKALTFVATIAALLGPILQWEGKLSQFDRAALGHSIIVDRVKVLLSDLKLSDAPTAEHFARIGEIEAFRGALTALDETGNKGTKALAWKQAEEELPTSRAWDLV